MRNPFDDPFSVLQRDARGVGLLAYWLLVMCLAGVLR